ncbi:MAG: RluA family pseudouridine synthase [Acidobacteriota bacterium]|nr:RluA family pseudouridine synthase [Acidobacteriota bacterium]
MNDGNEAQDAGAEQLPDALTFEVSLSEAGERLDAYLAARIAGTSRTTLKRLVEDGDVLVGGRLSKPSYKLRVKDVIEVELAAPPPLNLTPENIPLDIIYEDDELIVVNKPAGMVVHPAAGVSSGTLANALAYRMRNHGLRIADCGLRIEEDFKSQISDFRLRSGEQQADSASESNDTLSQNTNTQSAIRNPQSAIEASAIRNPQSLRPGIVHRLDRNTSGLLVVAKTASAHENLSEQFRAREVFKSYVALAHGRISGEGGRIAEPLARDPRQRTQIAVVRGGREALTLYRVRRCYERFTLLDVEIKTGRTHQIRVHLAWLKHPVVGDETYGAGRDRNVPDAQVRLMITKLNRQFLHAAHLGFRHPRTGESVRFSAPLPGELQEFLDGLK